MRSLRALAGLLVLAAMLPATSAHASPQPGTNLQADGRWLIENATRRAVFLHGVNVVSKRPPYVPSPAQFGPADAALMHKLGFNVVRLGVIWKGLEPERGHFDEAYLDRIDQIVDVLVREGIYTLLDFHQDVWNEKYGGEGAPDWATIDDGTWTGLEPSVFSGWASRYFTPGVGRAFDNFWADAQGIQQAYIDALVHVAGRFHWNEGVIGYDLMNEPFPGFGVWAGFNTPLAEATRLQPFYERAIAAIRETDHVHTIWYEPSVSNDFGAANGLGQLQPIEGYNLGMSFHVYCIAGETVVPGGDNNTPYCDALEDRAWQEQQTARDRNDDGWFLSEFGATDDLVDVGQRMAQADDHLVGWAYWSWKLYDDPTGAANEGLVTNDTGPLRLKPEKAAALSRTYAQLVAGRPISMSFDPATDRFELRFATIDAYAVHLRSYVASPTVIYVPVNRHYREGYQVVITGPARVVSRPNAMFLKILNTGGGTVTVTVMSNRPPPTIPGP